jgi:hypothetical protein
MLNSRACQLKDDSTNADAQFQLIMQVRLRRTPGIAAIAQREDGGPELGSVEPIPFRVVK